MADGGGEACARGGHACYWLSYMYALNNNIIIFLPLK